MSCCMKKNWLQNAKEFLLRYVSNFITKYIQKSYHNHNHRSLELSRIPWSISIFDFFIEKWTHWRHQLVWTFYGVWKAILSWVFTFLMFTILNIISTHLLSKLNWKVPHRYLEQSYYTLRDGLPHRARNLFLWSRI